MKELYKKRPMRRFLKHPNEGSVKEPSVGGFCEGALLKEFYKGALCRSSIKKPLNELYEGAL